MASNRIRKLVPSASKRRRRARELTTSSLSVRSAIDGLVKWRRKVWDTRSEKASAVDYSSASASAPKTTRHPKCFFMEGPCRFGMPEAALSRSEDNAVDVVDLNGHRMGRLLEKGTIKTNAPA
jgi:hypothetical protein